MATVGKAEPPASSSSSSRELKKSRCQGRKELFLDPKKKMYVKVFDYIYSVCLLQNAMHFHAQSRLRSRSRHGGAPAASISKHI